MYYRYRKNLKGHHKFTNLPRRYRAKFDQGELLDCPCDICSSQDLKSNLKPKNAFFQQKDDSLWKYS
jgi:hypothetical protein